MSKSLSLILKTTAIIFAGCLFSESLLLVVSTPDLDSYIFILKTLSLRALFRFLWPLESLYTERQSISMTHGRPVHPMMLLPLNIKF